VVSLIPTPRVPDFKVDGKSVSLHPLAMEMPFEISKAKRIFIFSLISPVCLFVTTRLHQPLAIPIPCGIATSIAAAGRTKAKVLPMPTIWTVSFSGTLHIHQFVFGEHRCSLLFGTFSKKSHIDSILSVSYLIFD
jgi:hypothetical protein